MDTDTRTDALSPLRREWRRCQIGSGLSRAAFGDAVRARVAIRQGRPGQVVFGEAPAVWIEVAREVASEAADRASEAAEAAEMADIERRACYYAGGIEA